MDAMRIMLSSAQYGRYGDFGWGGGMMGPGYGFGWFGPVFMLVFWAAFIVGVVLLIRWAVVSSGGRKHGEAESAIELLKKRYARGEIDKEEFNEKKKELQG